MNKILSAAAFIFLLAFASCNSCNNSKQQDTLDKIKSEKKIKVGYISYFDITFKNGSTGETKGFLVDVLQEALKDLNIPKENIHLLDGTITDPLLLKNHLLQYEQAIDKVGGIDLQILGIGGNGHIAFNEPGTDLNSTTHLVSLDEKTRRDNERFFSDLSLEHSLYNASSLF